MAEKTRVRFNNLGRSGLRVSNFSLGTATFGDDWQRSAEVYRRPGNLGEAGAHEILDRFTECGGNLIDMSDTYNNGQAEEIVGSWLTKQDRRKVLLASKFFFGAAHEKGTNTVGSSRMNIFNSVDDSLARLQTEYIDLYQMHSWDNHTPIEETLTALNDLVSLGKVRYLGATNVTGWQLQKMVDITRERRLAPIVSLQAEYNLLVRDIELELVDVCKNEGIGLIAWSPLKGGWLTGKIKRDEGAPENTRIAWASKDPDRRTMNSNPVWQEWATDRTWKILDTLKTVATDAGRSMAHVSLRWLLQKDMLSSVTLGCKTIEQFNENIEAATDWCLTSQQMEDLDHVSKLGNIYPYSMIAQNNAAIRRCFQNR